ncbi:hypothetical protein GCM10010267_04100 [Streptomyces griseorubens]|nr:hypothetical protein GCM10010267_04100 [Streptomyces griseorubens]
MASVKGWNPAVRGSQDGCAREVKDRRPEAAHLRLSRFAPRFGDRCYQCAGHSPWIPAVAGQAAAPCAVGCSQAQRSRCMAGILGEGGTVSPAKGWEQAVL